MAVDVMRNVTIRGIACAVPDNVVFTEDYKETFGLDAVNKFADTVGIKQRHMSKIDNGLTTSDLCFAAAEKLIAEKHIDKNTIDAVILVTQHPDYISCPATACVLQYRLGLSENCLAYDVNQGCTGYIYGLYIAALHLQSGRLKRVLLLAGDAGHRVSPEDKSMAMLFGDAGSATLLEYDKSAQDMNFVFKTQGKGFRSIICPCGGSRNRTGNAERTEQEAGIIRSDYDGYMDGVAVFNFTIKEVPKLFRTFYEHFNYTNDSFDFFLLHQANKYMLQYICKKLKLPVEKVPLSIDRYGNTSSASIPITLCDYFAGNKDTDGKKNILGCGFGVGLSLGIANFNIDSTVCLPVIVTDERFEDGML